jgi:hypothetical protein
MIVTTNGLISNIILSWKGSPGANALAYSAKVSVKKAKSFITLVSVHHRGGDESDERGRSQNCERVPGENPQMSMDSLTDRQL